jgi:outer membrane protein assembly factor BamB
MLELASQIRKDCEPLPLEKRQKYEGFAKKWEETSNKLKKEVKRLEEKLEELQKTNDYGLKITQLEQLLEETNPVLTDLRSRIQSELNRLKTVEQEAKDRITKIEALIEEEEYDKAYKEIEELKNTSLLDKTEAVRKLQYFEVIACSTEFNVPLRFNGQNLGMTPCVYRYSDKNPFADKEQNYTLLNTEPGFRLEKPDFLANSNKNLQAEHLKPKPWRTLIACRRETAWKFTADKNILNPPFIGENQEIVIGDNFGNLYVLLDGSETERYTIRGSINRGILYPYVASKGQYFFCSENKTLYAYSKNKSWEKSLKGLSFGVVKSPEEDTLFVFDPGLGLRWFNFNSEELGSLPLKSKNPITTFAPPFFFNLRNNSYILCSYEQTGTSYLTLYRKNSSSLSLLENPKIIATPHWAPHLYKNTLYFASQKNLIFSYQLTSSDGQMKFKKSVQMVFPEEIQEPLYLEEDILVACNDAHLYCYDYDGKLKWKTFIPDVKIKKTEEDRPHNSIQRFTAKPVHKGDQIFVAADNETIYCFHKQENGLKYLWNYAFESKANALKVHGNTLIVAGDKKGQAPQLVAIDITN